MSSRPIVDQCGHRKNVTGTGTGIYLAFAPWVLFTVITAQQSLTVVVAASVAWAAAAISVPGVIRGRPQLLELAAVVASTVFTVVAWSADPTAGEWVVRYARASTISNWVIPVLLILWAVKRTAALTRTVEGSWAT